MDYRKILFCNRIRYTGNLKVIRAVTSLLPDWDAVELLDRCGGRSY